MKIRLEAGSVRGSPILITICTWLLLDRFHFQGAVVDVYWTLIVILWLLFIVDYFVTGTISVNDVLSYRNAKNE